MKTINKSLDTKNLDTEIKRLIYKADYDHAVSLLKKLKEKYPNDFYILSNLATLPHENAFHGTHKQRQAAFIKAAKGLKPLLRKMRGVSERQRYRTRNEYYWFSQQHLKQFNLGKQYVNKGLIYGLYSQGVGASNHSFKLRQKGLASKSLKWAVIAQNAWESYFKKVTNRYFDPWTWYALSLGIQGKTKEMENALIRAAKLANLNYRKDPILNRIRNMANINLKI